MRYDDVHHPDPPAARRASAPPVRLEYCSQFLGHPLNTTILLTTHDLDEAERLADRILILAGGTIIADGSAGELARAMPGQSEVRWSLDGQRFVHAADDATAFVRELFRRYGESVEDLEMRRASLEDTYMALVRQAEDGVPRRLTAVAA